MVEYLQVAMHGVPGRFCPAKFRPRGHNGGTQQERGGALWIHVISHFDDFLRQLCLTVEECREDADGKADRVARCLWNNYYVGEFNPGCYLKVGSYGKGTSCRPQSDLDMLFLLPWSVHARVVRLLGNRQSQLLQEVKRNLLETFPGTDLRADRQVCSRPFHYLRCGSGSCV